MARINLGKVVPEKGVDYYTNEEKAELEAELSAEFATQIAGKEDLTNKVTDISSSSTDTQYPSAKLLYDKLQEKQAEIDNLYEAQPTNTITTTSGVASVNDSSNLQLKDIQVLGNATQDSTPTPNTPVAINVVTGDVQVNVVGKNVFTPIDNYMFRDSGIASHSESVGSITLTTTNSGTSGFALYKIGNIKDYIGKTLTLSVISTTDTSIFKDCGFMNCDSSGSNRTTLATLGTGNTTKTFTLDDTYTQDILAFRVYLSNVSSSTSYTLENIQVEVSSTASTFEPYRAQTLPLNLGSIELAKIGTYTDRIYKSSGKWYVEKLTRAVTQSNFTSTQAVTSSIGNNLYAYACAITGLNKNYTSLGAVISNLFSAKILGQTSDMSSDNVRYNMGIAKHSSVNSGQLIISIEKTLLDNGDVDTFTSYLTTNNFYALVLMETPTTTEITDTDLITQLEQVLAMTTYKTTTNAFTLTVSDNATPTLVMEYRQDIGTLINNLDARLSLLE